MRKLWERFRQFWRGLLSGRKREISLEGFANQAKSFCGLYEALYIASGSGEENNCHDVLMEWRIRLSQMTKEPFSRVILGQIAAAEESGDYGGCCQWLLGRIFKEGILRDTRKHIQLEELDLLRYGTIDGRMPVLGENAEILCPCWYYGDYLLERGMLS